MNAYHMQRLAADAVYGAKAVKQLCEERDGQCQGIDGLPDCPLCIPSEGNVPARCKVMSEDAPMYWVVK